MLEWETISETRQLIHSFIQRTPLLRCEPERRPACLRDVDLHMKLELFQYSGSFKLRGALSVALRAEKTVRGFTAVSAGNHAISVAYVGRLLKQPSKVVMISTANPARVERANSYGAELVFADTGALAFQEVERIQKEEGFYFIHPFDGPLTTAGTATLGLEILEDSQDPDFVIVPVGGGGLASGVALAIKEKFPRCKVIGVNVKGAEAMAQSMSVGEKRGNDGSILIADSLCPPFVGDYAFQVCQRYLDEMIVVSPEEISEAMSYLWIKQKMMVEGAAASALAAAMGPLRSRLSGKRIVVVLSGSNIDFQKFRGEANIS